MFEGFAQQMIKANGVTINYRVGGKGKPLLLLHGYPQTHVMWHKIAPQLAERYMVVVSDLRGYGDSSKPPGDPEHKTYSKRVMAADQVALMQALGHERFTVIGHDRGARVAHRMTLDHQARIEKMAVLDIVPTLDAMGAMDQERATAYSHWFFLIQPDGLPERLIGNDPAFWLKWCLKRWGGPERGLSYFDEAAIADYVRCFSEPAAIHASCEDYRAGASIDMVYDREDLGRQVTCPSLAVWGGRGRVAKWWDVKACWQARCATLSTTSLDAGHFLVEERPAETTAELLRFLSD
ncbi:MAG: alpha/beta hydrolase [Alphaproteobacteria bacterium]|nr:alpha/beta hydrolase [Alphaproteobacteria bacterium]